MQLSRHDKFLYTPHKKTCLILCGKQLFSVFFSGEHNPLPTLKNTKLYSNALKAGDCLFACLCKSKACSEVCSIPSCSDIKNTNPKPFLQMSDVKPHAKKKKKAYYTELRFFVFQFQNTTLKTTELVCICWSYFKQREAFLFMNEEIPNWERNTTGSTVKGVWIQVSARTGELAP